MPIQTQDLILEAETSLNHNTECGDRACISRSYYAVYHELLPKAEIAGFDTTSPSSHVRLVAFIKSRKKWLSDRLNDLRKSRIDADYRLDVTIAPLQAKSVIEESKRLISSIQKMNF